MLYWFEFEIVGYIHRLLYINLLGTIKQQPREDRSWKTGIYYVASKSLLLQIISSFLQLAIWPLNLQFCCWPISSLQLSMHGHCRCPLAASVVSCHRVLIYTISFLNNDSPISTFLIPTACILSSMLFFLRESLLDSPHSLDSIFLHKFLAQWIL